jgi:hypothetical protein
MKTYMRFYAHLVVHNLLNIYHSKKCFEKTLKKETHFKFNTIFKGLVQELTRHELKKWVTSIFVFKQTPYFFI